LLLFFIVDLVLLGEGDFIFYLFYYGLVSYLLYYGLVSLREPLLITTDFET